MIRQKNSINLKIVVFIAIYAALIAFSLAWYNALTAIDCSVTGTLANTAKTNSLENAAHNCSEQLHFHWIKFYGINGLIYGASLLVFVVNTRRANKT